LTNDRSWEDRDAPWWVKADRAQEHLVRLRKEVGEFRATRPYTLDPEPTTKPDVLAYRLRYRREVPTTISATIGDVLHNLRAALENLAFEVARRDQGGLLAENRAHLPTFPICDTPEAFDQFVSERTRKGLEYTSRGQAALRSEQPFVIVERSHKLGVALHERYDENFRWSCLHRLDKLWNVDKHRRLTLMAWWLDLLWWGSNGPSNRRVWPGEGVRDGAILFYLKGKDEGNSDVQHEFNLVLTDDPAYSGDNQGCTEDVVAMLTNWHRHIANCIFPSVFKIMSTQPATIGTTNPESVM
jgi:hypothetical protein